MRRIAFAASLFALLLAAGSARAADAESLLLGMPAAYAKVKSYVAIFDKKELIGSSLFHEKLFYKFMKPFSVYVKYMTKPIGREAIYRRGWNDGKVKVSKATFANVTVNLSPLGSLAMENQHHPILHIGFGHYIDDMTRYIKLARDRGDGKMKVIGTLTVGDRTCANIALEVNPKAGTTHTVGADESFSSIAAKYKFDPMMLRHVNKGKKAKEGETIWVPTYYTSYAEICICNASGLPLVSKVKDFEGRAYEEYVYDKLVLNPPGLTDKDFDPENPSYDF
jgi:hypothetical protein